MRLKVVTPQKQEVIVIHEDATLKDLLQQLQDQGSIATTNTTNGDQVKIKSGFPPKLVDLADLNVPLGDVGIRAGDKLIVEEPVSQDVKSAHPEQQQQQQQERSRSPPSPPTITSTTTHIRMSDGYCVLRSVPDDNSCLFRSISYAVFHNLEEGSQLRSVVADSIKEDPITFDDAILGKPVDEYINWILKPTSWGGAIELQILSKYLNVTINSVDVETGRVDVFNEGQSTFIYLLYSGIHYDTVAFTPLNDIDDKELDITVHEDGSSLGFEFAKVIQRDLTKKLNQKGYVTNTNTFKVKCLVCGTILDGDKAATKHAKSTMHYEFGEV